MPPIPPWVTAMLNGTSQGVTVADAHLDDLPIIWVNRSFETLTGYPAAEILGRNCRFLQDERTDPSAVAQIRAAIASRTDLRITLRNVRRDGTPFWNELTLMPVRDSRGELTHVVGLQRDATAEVDAIRRLAEREDQRRVLLDTMSEGLVMQDSGGRIVLANRRAEEILGLSGAELQGQTSDDRAPNCIRRDGSPFPGEEHPAMIALRTGAPQDDVMMGVYQPTGALRWIRINARPHPGTDGHPTAVVTSFADVTEREALFRQHDALRRVAMLVASGAPSDEVFALATSEAARIVEVHAACLAKFTGDDHVKVLGAAASGEFPYRVGQVVKIPPDGDFRRLLELRRPFRTDHQAGSESPAAADGWLGASVAAPVFVRGRLWGGLIVMTTAAGRLMPGAEARIGEFADLISLAVAEAEERAQLVERATTDPLTRLLNHRAFHERLRAETSRAARHRRSLAVAILDIDHFKTVNDAYGHQFGDEVLSEFARRLRPALREEDVLARLGGDEFAVIMPETDAFAAYASIERVRHAISAVPLANGVRVTVSAGLADVGMAEDPHQLFQLADGALYWSKAHGRNATWIYNPEVVRELSAAERAEHLRRSHALLGIRALARAIDAKDAATRKHSERVATLAADLSRHAGWSDEATARLYEAALVHDVGKIGVPDSILFKPGRLSPEEYEQVKGHAALGAEIVADVLDAEQVQWIRGHHERPDGAGYPDGLTAETLSDGAGLLALADAFDVMTSDRRYQLAQSIPGALEECRGLAGTQFMPAAVQALLALHADGGSSEDLRGPGALLKSSG